MKLKLVTQMASFIVLMTLAAFSSAGGCYSQACPTYACQSNACADTISPCDCTDPECKGGCTGNQCMSRAKCCQAFGNLGALKEKGSFSYDQDQDS